MKQPIQAKTDDELLHNYPISGKLEGWFFRTEERSAACWIAEGIDRYGRKVCREGFGPDELLRLCIADAQSITDDLRATWRKDRGQFIPLDSISEILIIIPGTQY